MADLKEKLFGFVKSPHEYPLFAGFFSGFYVLVFYYSNNFELANSWQQLLFLASYFVLLPMVACFLAYRILVATRLQKYARQVLFILMSGFFSFYVLQNFYSGASYTNVFFLALIGIILLSFKVSNYKMGMILVVFMSAFPTLKIGYILFKNVAYHSDWNKQPDAIADCSFQKKPNVYYIQVDGYANPDVLKSKPYHYDNSKFDTWLKQNGFTVYEHFRSNYPTTLTSNASCFNMKHHYAKVNSNFKTARDYIMDDNLVLEIFKRNKYKTFFISERPYLLMNRPNIAFDYCNFNKADLPYMKDGWEDFKVIASEIKAQISKNKATPNFFFIEKFDPGHIVSSKNASRGLSGERSAYIKKLETANTFLYDVVGFIQKNDPEAIVIVGSDHGGYVGFEYTDQAQLQIDDKVLLESIFGASLAIKWNRPEHTRYDAELKTSVNVFRTVFSFLSEDQKYLQHLQEDGSYQTYGKTTYKVLP